MSKVNDKCFYCGKVIVRATVGNGWIHRRTGVAACNGGDPHDPSPPQAKPVEQFERDIPGATQEGDTLILTTDRPIETPAGWQRVK